METSAAHLGYARVVQDGQTFGCMKKWFAKAKLRASRIGRLAKATHKTTMLFKTGAVPQATYGSNLLDLTKALRRDLDSIATGRVKKLGYRPDKTCSFWVQYGYIPSVAVTETNSFNGCNGPEPSLYPRV